MAHAGTRKNEMSTNEESALECAKTSIDKGKRDAAPDGGRRASGGIDAITMALKALGRPQYGAGRVQQG